MPFSSRSSDEIADIIGGIAWQAGQIILDVVAKGFSAHRKSDGSSYTDADLAAEQYILKELERFFPGVPVIAEEETAVQEPEGVGNRQGPQAFFLVDPLDGTSGFIRGGQDYTVNIAAVSGTTPLAGTVYAPATGQLWLGGETARKATCSPNTQPVTSDFTVISTRPAPAQGLVAFTSHRHNDGHTEVFLSRLPIVERRSASSSLKFCLIAQGDGDIYPRFGQTMEWDTAAADAVLRAAGGIVLDPQGQPLVYGRPHDHYINGPFIAWGDPEAAKTYQQR